MNWSYVGLRLVRRLLPRALARQMLDVGFVLKPGLETAEPAQAVERYRAALGAAGVSLAGKAVLVFGYGGGFGVGVLLLLAGAASVTLCDRFARPSRRRNRHWVETAPEYFHPKEGTVCPDPDRLELLHGDIREIAGEKEARFDIVLSSSVFEHLDDVDGVCAALAALTRRSGVHLHYIDVRDHYFRCPFEMLTFSESVWRRFLNPGSNLNRLRPWEYRSIFEHLFERVRLEVVHSEWEAFRHARARIRPEYLSGDEVLDAAGVVQVTASGPRSEAPLTGPVLGL